MSNQTQGRGGGRLSGRGRFSAFPQPAGHRGANPSIGAYLSCAGKGPSANDTAIWAGKIKDFAMTKVETNIDDIFGANGASGEYPTREDPELPDDEEDKVAFKIWDVSYNLKVKFDEKLRSERTQLFGIMVGQISDQSKDLIKETAIGRDAFTNKDPLMLLKGAILTHMSDSRLGANQGLHKAQEQYHHLRMEAHETVSSYFQKTSNALTALEEAHIRCGNDPALRVDDDEQKAIKFIYGLANSYGEFKSFYENKLLPYPTTLEDAFTEASTFRVNRADNVRHQSRIDMFITGERNGGGGRGRGKQSAARGIKPICFNCGKDGHKAPDCRSTALDHSAQEVARAIAAQRTADATNSSSTRK